MKGSNAWYAANELTVNDVPTIQACLLDIRLYAIGLFFVLAIIASYSASLICPKHYVDIATVCVAKINKAEFNRPTPINGAWK